MMTNLEAWRFYLKDAPSPESFITMSFYGMIAAALQRRVYLGSDERPLFPNLYTILVAEPGIGKSFVLEPTMDILRTHKLERLKIESKQDIDNLSTQEQLDAVQSLMAEMNTTNQQPLNGAFRKLQKLEEPLMIPVAADATTYESLVRYHAESLRSIFPEKCKESRLLKNKLYTHSSICFCLEEISSLFRKHTDDVVNYLIKVYGCQDYKYSTKTQGVDKVINSCLNLIGGTTPGFLRDTFNDKLLNEGFASRTIFTFEEENRFYRFDVSTFSPEQLAAKQKIIDHIKNLTKLFGLVTYAPEAKEFMKHYIEEVLGRQRIRTNPSPKLLHYYARKNIHVQKLATAIHFADNIEMEIGISSCQEAVKLLDTLEVKMDKALVMGGRNPLGKVADKIYRFLKMQGPKSLAHIWIEFVDDVNERELGEALEYLRATGKVEYLGNETYQAL